MPSKTNRQRFIADSRKLARKAKQSQALKAKRSRTMYGENSSVCINKENESDELFSTTAVLDTDNEETGPSFMLESSMMSDTD